MSRGLPPILPRPRSRPEWAVFGASLLVIGAIIAVLGWSAAGSSGDTARFEAVIEETQERAGSFHVQISVKNVGDETASDVSVYAEVGEGAAATRVQQTVDQLFGGERQQLTFVFPEDPRERTLHIGVEAYQEP